MPVCTGVLTLAVRLVASCSFLFGEAAPMEQEAGPSDASAYDGAIDAGFSNLSDDFESGALASSWNRVVANGDTCFASHEQSADGNWSLHCTTNNQWGTQAAVYVDLSPTRSVRVQMDVLFETLPAGWWLIFLQTAHVDAEGGASTALLSSDLYSSGLVDVWNYNDEQSMYAPDSIELHTWYHMDFRAVTSNMNGFVSLQIDGGTNEALLVDVDTTDLPINRLYLGVIETDEAIDELSMFIDNVEISVD